MKVKVKGRGRLKGTGSKTQGRCSSWERRGSVPPGRSEGRGVPLGGRGGGPLWSGRGEEERYCVEHPQELREREKLDES